MDTRKGGSRYCPNCKKVVETRVLLEGYGQTDFHGILAKKRQIICWRDPGGLEGCGTRWFTLEIPEAQISGPGEKRGWSVGRRDSWGWSTEWSQESFPLGIGSGQNLTKEEDFSESKIVFFHPNRGRSWLKRLVDAWSLRLKREGMMKISCAKRCRIQEVLGNLRCPNCFSVKPKAGKGDSQKIAESQDCQCQIEIRSEDLLYRWD